MTIFIVLFSAYSYEKIEEANEEYCEALMNHYVLQIDQMIMELRQHVALVNAHTIAFWEKSQESILFL